MGLSFELGKMKLLVTFVFSFGVYVDEENLNTMINRWSVKLGLILIIIGTKL